MIEVEIEDAAWTAALPDAAAVAERAATAALGGVVGQQHDDIALDRSEGGGRRPFGHGRGVGQGGRPGRFLDLDLDHASGSSRSAAGRRAAASAS